MKYTLSPVLVYFLYFEHNILWHNILKIVLKFQTVGNTVGFPYKLRQLFLLRYTEWCKKTSRTFTCIIWLSGHSESTQKHLCNVQTSMNMCRNFCLKHFCISHDTNKILLHAIKQFLPVVHHLHCRSYAGYTKTSQYAELSVTDQQKKMPNRSFILLYH